MIKLINKVWRDERGVSALEYAILAGCVVTAVAAAGAILSGTGTYSLKTIFTNIMQTVVNNT
ncbi:Flp family type IVb pilin [Paraburkholderia pallida]|uniref:Flp family type IVb pilin n=1 Tax=Paraburkholderia pallida TaxID=2547399 RepID=A0A4P7D082_9BURK|nr:Flp family type IVb pilin [Paraburkholderia pallida]QBR01248.1 Flp family type IVb pilin [Paraburkholderia pallida]